MAICDAGHFGWANVGDEGRDVGRALIGESKQTAREKRAAPTSAAPYRLVIRELAEPAVGRRYEGRGDHVGRHAHLARLR